MTTRQQVFNQLVLNCPFGTPILDTAIDLIIELEQQLAANQAKIDALMLEYCPDEMTPEQVANWAAHQAAIDKDM
jgi:hypothetical protein